MATHRAAVLVLVVAVAVAVVMVVVPLLHHDVVGNASGLADTLRYTWSTSDAAGAFVGIFTFDVPMAASHTFIPARSPGWSLAVPYRFPRNGKTFWAPVTKSEPCTDTP